MVGSASRSGFRSSGPASALCRWVLITDHSFQRSHEGNSAFIISHMNARLAVPGSAVQGDGQPSASGGAGHALQFSDHAIVLKHFKVSFGLYYLSCMRESGQICTLLILTFIKYTVYKPCPCTEPLLLQGFASDAFTFEAWIQAPSGCNRGNGTSSASHVTSQIPRDEPSIGFP